MKDFFLLVKAVQASGYRVGKVRKGKPVKQNRSIFSVFLIGFLLTLSFGSQVFSFLQRAVRLSFSAEDALPYLTLMFTGYFLYGLMMSLITCAPTFFRGNNDAFLPLPISGNRFFLAKFTIIFFINLAYGGLILLGTSLTACIMLHLSVASYFVSIALFLLYLFLAPCLSFFIFNFLARFLDLKNGKVSYIIITCVSVVIAAGSGILVNAVPSLAGETMTHEIAIAAVGNYVSYFPWLTWIGYLPAHALTLLQKTDYLSLLALLFITLLVVALSLTVSRRTYLTRLGKSFSSHRHVLTSQQAEKKKEKQMKLLDHPRRLIFHREFSNYLSDSSIFNGNAPQLSILLSLIITMVFMRISVVDGKHVPLMILEICGISFLLFSFFFTCLPFVALSLERKNLAYLKTFPLSYRKMLWQKLSPSVVLSLPLVPIIFVVYLCLVGFEADFAISLAMVALTYPMMIILYSFWIGTCFPNFSFEFSAELMNKGKGILLSHLGHIVFSTLGISLITSLYFVFHCFWIGTLIVSVLYAGLGVLFYFLGERKLKRLLTSELIL